MADLIDITLTPEQLEGTESVVSRWLKAPGDAVKQHEPVVEINTDKVTVEISAPASGVLREVLKKEQEPVQAGEIVARIERGASVEKTPSSDNASSPAPVSAELKSLTQDGAALSPAVRKLIEQHAIDPSHITGTGRGGRITHQDVMSFLETRTDSSPKETSDPRSRLSGKRVAHSAIRRSIAQHMVASLLHTAPHVTSVFEVDMSAVLRDRESRRAEFEKKGVKLTLTAYFIRAVVHAIQSVPEVNSRFHETELEIFEDCNIGVATAVTSGEQGLVVPVIRRAQALDLFETAKSLQDVTERARTHSLVPADVQGGTFTISNHGVSGSLFAAPIIINQPQSAILGIGKLEQRVSAILEHGTSQIVVRPKLYVTLTIDHRVLDGFQANTFLFSFVQKLENWPS